MNVVSQPTSNNTRVSENTSATNINANMHFSVSEALAESRLLERVRDYRRSSLEVSSVNSDLSDQQLAHRADVMLHLKDASEHFNALLSPVDVVHLQVLQELKLEQILSKYYWYTLFLANNHPEQGKFELDSLCSKLLNAKYSLSVVGFDIVNSAVEIDANVYPEHDSQRVTATELPSISPEVLSAISPNAASSTKAVQSVDINTPDSPSATARPGALSRVISELVAGLSALLLIMLAVSVFAPEFVQMLQTRVPAGSTPYRLIMLVLLFTLTTSCYLMVSKLINSRAGSADSVAKTNSDLFSGLFNIDASPGRILAGVVAPVLFGLGLGVATSAGFGSFGFALLLNSLNSTLLAPVWLVLPILTISCCLLAWFWGRVSFGLGTLVALNLIGPAIVVGSGFAPAESTFAGNFIALLLGLILFSGGISLAAAAASGPDGLTALSLAAERMQNWPIALSIVLWDLTAVAAGVILGGSVGVATIVGLIAVPILVQLFLPAFRRVLV